jgi:hypothetical protein
MFHGLIQYIHNGATFHSGGLSKHVLGFGANHVTDLFCQVTILFCGFFSTGVEAGGW